MKKQKRLISRSKSSSILCPFEHYYACWANNHNGWAKAKKWYRRYDKHILKRQDEAEIQQQIQDYEDFLLDCAIEDDELSNYMGFLYERYDDLNNNGKEFFWNHYYWWKNYIKNNYGYFDDHDVCEKELEVL